MLQYLIVGLLYIFICNVLQQLIVGLLYILYIPADNVCMMEDVLMNVFSLICAEERLSKGFPEDIPIIMYKLRKEVSLLCILQLNYYIPFLCTYNKLYLYHYMYYIYIIYTTICIIYTTICIIYTTICIIYTTICIIYTTICIIYTTICIIYTTICIIYTTICIIYTTICIIYTTIYIIYTTIRMYIYVPSFTRLMCG